MNKLSVINAKWPDLEIEFVKNCPFCNSVKRKLAYEDVQDWSFYATSGKWNYWDCLDCKTLYLDPRPKEAFIHKAYSNYYTHEDATSSVMNQLKIRTKNEILAKKYAVKLYPNLHFPIFFKHILSFFNKIIYEPYGLSQITTGTKGRLMDIGCGGGLMLSIAQQYGWEVMGLEFDADAVKAANQKGLPVRQGSYEKLESYPDYFDLIYCSHVLEHVYNPKEMLVSFKRALKPNGKLLLSLPNSQSFLRKMYGASWRGIEAPRHIAIPSQVELIKYLQEIGFKTHVEKDVRAFTKLASRKIANDNSMSYRKLNFSSSFIDESNQDFCFITATA
jgi:2-polyprenyl-3-methyl-5-hydroxy-6-metoxy-1,4-benzoquinol methylase